jgi:plasmid stabilization system protein ParE
MTTTANVVPIAEWRRYVPTPFAPRDARRVVDDLLARWGYDGARASAALLTSELMADALSHSPGSIALLVELGGDALRVEVSDDPGLIPDASAGSVERRVARRLMDKLASNWGSDLDRDGTRTWFSLRTADAERPGNAA